MSKRTDNVRNAIKNLSELQKQLSEYNKTVNERVLQDIEFKMGQELFNLNLWFDSLYKFNGESTSYAKKQASKENGKKGGRPPKEITMARRRLEEIKELLAQQEHQYDMSDDEAERKKLEDEMEALKTEKYGLEIKLNRA